MGTIWNNLSVVAWMSKLITEEKLGWVINNRTWSYSSRRQAVAPRPCGGCPRRPLSRRRLLLLGPRQWLPVPCGGCPRRPLSRRRLLLLSPRQWLPVPCGGCPRRPLSRRLHRFCPRPYPVLRSTWWPRPNTLWFGSFLLLYTRMATIRFDWTFLLGWRLLLPGFWLKLFWRKIFESLLQLEIDLSVLTSFHIRSLLSPQFFWQTTIWRIF